jgi:hypothetical protein
MSLLIKRASFVYPDQALQSSRSPEWIYDEYLRLRQHTDLKIVIFILATAGPACVVVVSLVMLAINSFVLLEL